MNRRSFFAFLIGAPIAAVTGMKMKVFPDGVKMWPIHRVRIKPADWAKIISENPLPEPKDEETWDYDKIYGPGDSSRTFRAELGKTWDYKAVSKHEQT